MITNTFKRKNALHSQFTRFHIEIRSVHTHTHAQLVIIKMRKYYFQNLIVNKTDEEEENSEYKYAFKIA